MPYNPTSVEKKWQAYWLTNRTFRALDPSEAGQKPKKYILDMFPYPSGQGLHVGHPEGYTATDIISRYYRMKGFNVLHTMGWDAFGLPAEQYAVKTNTHPRITTQTNITRFREQIRSLGLSYDWDREIDTTDPTYYKWTQWIFLQLYNSYFDPFDQKAKPIDHLISELENDNIVVAGDGSIHINPVHEGMEAISGDAGVYRKWSSYDPAEQRAIIDGQRLAYVDDVPVNWCPGLGTVLANEEVIDGKSEVGGFPVERRPMRQWMLRITAYADRLLADLDTLDWSDSLKEMQRNWIGKSVGAEVDFEVAGSGFGVQGSKNTSPTTSSSRTPNPEPLDPITVFTTRPDTLFGATYMVLAPEHELVDAIVTPEQKSAVDAYRAQAKGKSERDRMTDVKDKTGVFTGAYAINPVNDQPIPIWIADYVLMGYGTGAIMAVPAHDERDFEFATKFGLPIKQVVTPANNPESFDTLRHAFSDEGVAINSDFIDGLTTAEAKERMIEFLEIENVGRRQINYKLRDWLFSRQRYWGEPFPIVLDEMGNHFPLKEEELPVTLPEMEDFKPTGTPEPPLSKAKDWIAYSDTLTRETNTMPQWAGSCWYYLRYIDPKNPGSFVDSDKERYWMPVDLYIGGVEHAVLHLLYARFWHKVLFDLGHVSTPEPFQRLVNQGLILGETEFHFFEGKSGPVSVSDVTGIDEEATERGLSMFAFHKQTGEKLVGTRVIEQLVEKKGDKYVLRSRPEIAVDARSFKMSKSRGNVVNPDEIITEHGADAFRMYEMYMGPLEAQKPWNTRDIAGLSRLLNGVWRNLVGDEESNKVATISDVAIPDDLDRQLHRAIKKVGDDIEALRFNTAIAELFKLNNAMNALSVVPKKLADTFVLLLSPFAPHIAEELWERLGHTPSVQHVAFPAYDPAKLIDTMLDLPVQVNGKLRDRVSVDANASEADIFRAVEASEKMQPWLAGKTIKKRVYVPKKMVNYVVN